MRERYLYRGLNDFQGSIDEEGRLYDETHGIVGRIDGDTVYDNCNIRQGTIADDGKLWDREHNLVGEEHGSDFISPSYQSSGLVRGDSFGEGRGSEYGALMMLKKRNKLYSGEVLREEDYEFGNDYDGNDDDDGDGYDDDYDSTMDDGFDDDGWEESRPTASSCRRAKRSDNDNSASDTEGCGMAIGCLAILILIFFCWVFKLGSSW